MVQVPARINPIFKLKPHHCRHKKSEVSPRTGVYSSAMVFTYKTASRCSTYTLELENKKSVWLHIVHRLLLKDIKTEIK